MRRAINGAIIRDSKILIVKKKEIWILPGGKPEENESEIDCLMREIAEEIPLLEIGELHYFGVFEGITPHKCDVLVATVYLSYPISDVNLEPGAEIRELAWIPREQIAKYPLSDITRKIFDQLVQEGNI